jgi:hypothetical protein
LSGRIVVAPGIVAPGIVVAPGTVVAPGIVVAAGIVAPGIVGGNSRGSRNSGDEVVASINVAKEYALRGNWKQLRSHKFSFVTVSGRCCCKRGV